MSFYLAFVAYIIPYSRRLEVTPHAVFNPAASQNIYAAASRHTYIARLYKVQLENEYKYNNILYTYSIIILKAYFCYCCMKHHVMMYFPVLVPSYLYELHTTKSEDD